MHSFGKRGSHYLAIANVQFSTTVNYLFHSLVSSKLNDVDQVCLILCSGVCQYGCRGKLIYCCTPVQHTGPWSGEEEEVSCLTISLSCKCLTRVPRDHETSSLAFLPCPHHLFPSMLLSLRENLARALWCFCLPDKKAITFHLPNHSGSCPSLSPPTAPKCIDLHMHTIDTSLPIWGYFSQ